MKYEMTAPCAHCPFRNDIKPYLTSDRVHEIGDSLVRGEFPCHKTTVDAGDEDDCGRRVDTEDSQHCAGALILLEKMERPSQMMRVCERIGLYDRTKLKMDAPVFDSIDEMADAQELF